MKIPKTYLKDLVQKQCFHVKMDLWITKIPILCTDSQILRALFLKINFSPICYDILTEIALSQECNVRFKKKCIKIELKEQPFRKKTSILIFRDNWSLWMCWVTYKACFVQAYIWGKQKCLIQLIQLLPSITHIELHILVVPDTPSVFLKPDLKLFNWFQPFLLPIIHIIYFYFQPDLSYFNFSASKNVMIFVFLFSLNVSFRSDAFPLPFPKLSLIAYS